jgi:hypothetical protein
MRKVAVLAIALVGCAGADLTALDTLLPAAGVGNDESTVVAGLREALQVGARRAVAQTGRTDGYLGNPLIRIPLPDSLDTMARGLRAVGLGAKVDELEVGMNRAAERAAGEAVDVFATAIRGMSIADGYAVLRGGGTAATDYLQSRTSDTLRQRYEPIVSQAMDQVGLVSLYDSLLGRYQALPFTRSPSLDIRRYVTDRALDGLFTVLGQEEQRIREDPAARTSELLQRVFGGR